MGLDMYLLKRNKRQKHDYSNLVEIGYWRKANSIHKWFVDNCQDGVDDCQCYQVRKVDIETLLNLCKKVKASISLVEEEVEKDGEIKKKYKRKILESALAETDFQNEVIFYEASW